MSSTRRVIGAAGALAGALLLLLPAGAAGAEPAGAGQASAFGATISAGGQTVVPPTPEASLTAPPGGTVHETLVDIPAEPVAVSGTLQADAAVHGLSDLPSTLTVNSQAVAGPYNARAYSLVEGLDVLLDTPSEGVSLLSADAVRAEAVAVCAAGTAKYSANSEIVDLRVGGEAIPLNAPTEQIVDAIGDLLEQTTLNQVVDVERNVVTTTADGIAVDALVVTVLAAAGTPVAEVRIGHAEVRALDCTARMPECSDGSDNDGDGAVDHPADQQCTSPQDDSEAPECSNGRDDADPEDTLADVGSDPGCTDAADDSETDDGTAVNAGAQPGGGGRVGTPTLARTGGDASVALAAGLGLLGLAGLVLRRRLA